MCPRQHESTNVVGIKCFFFFPKKHSLRLFLFEFRNETNKPLINNSNLVLLKEQSDLEMT